jgi:hypothetical protein
MISELVLEGSGYGLIEVLSRNLFGGREENHANLSQDRLVPAKNQTGHLPNTCMEC